MRARLLLLLWLCLLLLPASGWAAELILNEYNAVNSSSYLNGGTLEADDDGGTAADPFHLRVLGNGGDWIELVVIAEGLDIRNWELEIYEDNLLDATLVFSNHAIWDGLEAGTIITIAEDVANDISYAPVQNPLDQDAGDWWIHVQASGDTPAIPAYITQTNFKVNNDDWQLIIKDDLGEVIYGPAGEGISPTSGVSSTEVCKLESPPSAVVLETDPGYDDGSLSSFGARNLFAGGSGSQDFLALRLNLPFPDRDGDGLPDDGDLSGVVGDLPCASGGSAGCDDNCPIVENPLQTDVSSVNGGPPDGIGDDCQCGDVDDSADVESGDDLELRQYLAGRISSLTAPDKCGVIHDGACTIVDAAAALRTIDGEAQPGIAPVCSAAFVPNDQTDLLFDPDRLLEIAITMAPGDWDALRFEGRDVFDTLGPGCMDGPPLSPYTFFPADITIDGQTLTNVGVRKKGFFGSASYTKPSIKVDFTEFAGAGQVFLGIDRLTLNNNKQDPAQVKQCLGYKLFRDAGLAASRCNFAHVTVNGQDMGIYSNVESIKEPYLARNFGDDGGNLYEGAISDFRPTWVNTFEKKTNVSNPSTADLDAIVTALTVPDVNMVATLDPLIDLDKFYTFWALEGILEHWDSHHSNRNNYWVYFNPANSGRMEFIPWGIDALLAGGNPLNGENLAPHPMALPRSQLTRRLYMYGPTQSAYLVRVNELMNTLWDETALLAELDRMEALLLPYLPGVSSSIALVRAKINSRRGEITTELGGGAPPWSEGLPPARCLADLGAISGTFNTTWDSLGGPFNGTGSMSVTFPSEPVSWTALSAEIGPGGPLGGGTLQIVGINGSNIRAAVLAVSPDLVEPGTVDLSPFLMFYGVAAAPANFFPLAMITKSTITFDPGTSSALPGDPVTGSFSGDLAWFTLVP